MFSSQNNDKYLKIDSHSSLLTNRELSMLFMEADSLNIAAGNTTNYNNVRAFYNTVDTIYMITSAIQSEEFIDKINNLRKKYQDILYLMDVSPNYFRTKKSLDMMHKITQEILIKIRHDLQKTQYFFRTSEKNNKGLSNIGFFVDESIFSDKKNKE